LQTAERLYI